MKSDICCVYSGWMHNKNCWSDFFYFSLWRFIICLSWLYLLKLDILVLGISDEKIYNWILESSFGGPENWKVEITASREAYYSCIELRPMPQINLDYL